MAALLALLVATAQLNFTNTWLAWLSDAIFLVAAAASGRFPRLALAVTLITSVALVFSGPSNLGIGSLASFIVAFSWFARDRRGQALAATLVALATYWCIGVGTEGFPPSPFTHVFIVLSAIISATAGVGWRRLVQLYAAQRADASRQLADVQASLARDLHDTVAQTLSHAAMRAWMAAEADEIPDETRLALEQIAKECSASASDLRQLLASLREAPVVADPQLGSLTDAHTLSEEVAAQAARLREAGFEVTTEIAVHHVTAARATTLSMVTREAVTNILKHATPGTDVSLAMVERDGVVEGTFSNHAPRARPGRTGWGVIGMEERMALLKGTLILQRLDGRWTVHVSLPNGIRAAPQESSRPD